MKLSRRDVLVGLGLAPALLQASPQPASPPDALRHFAPTTPMGWNSWDSFGPTTITPHGAVLFRLSPSQANRG